MVLVRDSFGYNKDIEQISKHQVSGKTVLALIVWLNGETRQSIVSMNCAIYSLFQFSYVHGFYKPNKITTKPSLKNKPYFQSYLNKQKDKYSTLDPSYEA